MTRVVGIIPSVRLHAAAGKRWKTSWASPWSTRVRNVPEVGCARRALRRTDDQHRREVERIGGSVIMTSPYHVSGTDPRRAIKSIDATSWSISGRLPFMNPCMIRKAWIRCCDPDLPMATMMRAVSSPTDLHNPDVVKVIINLKSRPCTSRRSSLPRGYKALASTNTSACSSTAAIPRILLAASPRRSNRSKNWSNSASSNTATHRVVLTQCRTPPRRFRRGYLRRPGSLEEMLNKRGITC